ncbi:MAG: hypothetical protein E7014_07175 [Alphaproteobacteria bacterium]|nr:hypothetical protein [Alphaproteobacteria bacterium]
MYQYLRIFISVCVGSIITISHPVFSAEEIDPIGHYSAWRAFKGVQDGKKTCFMAATPLHTSKKRDDVYLTVSRHPDDKQYNVITMMLGAPYRKGTTPTIGVDKNKVVAMFTNDDKAYIEKATIEKQIINQMIEGNVVRTQGRSQRGTNLKDTFSLKGFTRALEAITKECP